MEAAVIEKAPPAAPAEAKPLPSVVVFIPAHNEEERVGEVIRTVKRLYGDGEEKGYRVKVVVVDDGSSDGTVRVSREAGADRIISHGRNLGLGAATRTGLLSAREMDADIALKLDADLQHDPADIHRAIQPVLSDGADIVYGSRFAGRIHYRMPLLRRMGNLFFTWLMRKLTGWTITDAQTGLMVYGRRYLQDFHMPGDYNPPHQTLIDAYHRNLRYAEVPVDFHPRETGKSFISLKYPLKAFLQMLHTLVQVCPLKVFVPLGLASCAGGALLGVLDLVLNLTATIDGFHDGTIAVLLTFGLQSLSLGLIADLILRRVNGSGGAGSADRPGTGSAPSR